MHLAPPSHEVVETDEIKAAIDKAAQRWPHHSRADLIRKLILVGAVHVNESYAERTLEIDAALQALAQLSNDYPTGYREELRRDWVFDSTFGRDSSS